MVTTQNVSTRSARTAPSARDIDEVINQLRDASLAVDQATEFPTANWALLRDAGLLGVAVPQEYGGPGLRPSEWLRIVREMGKACPSTGLSYLMHLCATSVVVRTGGAELKHRFLPRVATGEFTVAYAGTERATGTNFWALESHANQVKNGWYVKLRKDWATLADVADVFVVPTRAHNQARPDEVSLFLVERSAGVTSEGQWRGTGMRASSSGAVLVDAVVPHDHLMGDPGRANEYITSEMFNLLLLSHAQLYLGIAEEAFRLGVEHASRRRFAHTGGTIGETSLWQCRFGEMSAQLLACGALLKVAAEGVDDPETGGALMKECLAAKIQACTLARHATDGAMQACGGSGYNMGGRVELLWRDARAGSLMRPSDEVAQILLGRVEEGLPPFAA